MVLEYVYCLMYELVLGILIYKNMTVDKKSFITSVFLLSCFNFLLTYYVGYNFDKLLTIDIPYLGIICSLLLIIIESYVYMLKTRNLTVVAFITTSFYCLYGFVTLTLREICIHILQMDMKALYYSVEMRFVLVAVILIISFVIVFIILKFIHLDQLSIPQRYVNIYVVLLILMMSISMLLSQSFIMFAY